MRYRAAVGVGEEAHSRQRHWCPWSKPVNVETWGHVPGPVVMAHAFAEHRYGIPGICDRSTRDLQKDTC